MPPHYSTHIHSGGAGDGGGLTHKLHLGGGSAAMCRVQGGARARGSDGRVSVRAFYYWRARGTDGSQRAFYSRTPLCRCMHASLFVCTPLLSLLPVSRENPNLPARAFGPRSPYACSLRYARHGSLLRKQHRVLLKRLSASLHVIHVGICRSQVTAYA